MSGADTSGEIEAGSVRPPPASVPVAKPEQGLCEIVLHGHRVFYRSGGSGPVLVLIHGITSTSATWAYVLPSLAEHFTVIAPGLIGHGESAKPRGTIR
jgi:alpha-beta hydrolase superfamily lysophospholipase